MDAHQYLARRGMGPRPMSTAPARGSEPRADRIDPRLGQGTRRDRTPSPVRRDPRADALVPRRAPEPRSSPASPPCRIDPRWYQIAMLSALLGYGVFGLHFDLGWRHIAAVIGVALGTQLVCTRLWRLPAFDPLSALISGIGLCTLLRTNGVAPAMFAAALAIGSKFVLRWRGKHLYNPTNLALVVMLVAGTGWISPGQYGHIAFVALLMVCMGLAVVNRAARSDVTLGFLLVYAGILFGRSLWLGEPLTIPLHRLQSGLLLQFSFNMISDPRTTPDSRGGRLLFGALVALGSGLVQFVLFRTNGPVWSLAVCTLLVPLLDRWLPGPRHQWKPVTATAGAPSRRIDLDATAGATAKGALHETPVPAAAAVRDPVAIGRA
jgi:enediyne biosynthesis protein E5